MQITVYFKISRSLSDENLEKIQVSYLSPANLNKQKTLNRCLGFRELSDVELQSDVINQYLASWLSVQAFGSG